MSERRPVAGFDRYTVSKSGEVYSAGRVAPLKKNPQHGYYRVCLYKNGKSVTRFVHTVVLEAFVGPRPLGMEAAHLDGDKSNNCAENLAWVSPKENHLHKLVHGTNYAGERHYRAKLTRDDIETIFALANDVSIGAIAELFGVCRRTIAMVISKKAWKDRSEDVAAATLILKARANGGR